MSQYSKLVNKHLLALQTTCSKEEFDELFGSISGHLLYIAKIYVSDKNLVEDVVAETFTRMLNYIDTFDPTQDGYNWLCRIAQRVAYDFNEKEKKIDLAEINYASKRQYGDYESVLSEMEFLDSIAILQDDEKDIMYRRFVCDESITEIAKSYKVSKAAISQRVKKICAKLEKNKK